MKLSTSFIAVSLLALTFNANAANPTFNHNGIQKNAISQSCYHDPCSKVKVMSFELLENEPDYRLIKLKVVDGYSGWNSKNTTWNHNFHNLYITCSLENPSVQNGDQITIIPINRQDSVPGVLYADTTLYLNTCHNFEGDSTDAAKKYGYNVRDW